MCITPEDFYTKAIEIFGTFTGGILPRFSATGVNFKKVYLDKPDVMGCVCDRIISICDTINGMTLESDEDVVKGRVVVTLENLKEFITSEAKEFEGPVQIDVFRLILILQMCALSGLFLEPHPINNKLAFVSEHTGAYNIILESFFKHYYKNNKGRRGLPDKDVEDFTSDEMRSTMPKIGADKLEEVIEALGEVLDIDEYDRQTSIEVLACESQPKRVNSNVTDPIIRGASQHFLSKQGVPMKKEFNSTTAVTLFSMRDAFYSYWKNTT